MVSQFESNRPRVESPQGRHAPSFPFPLETGSIETMESVWRSLAFVLGDWWSRLGTASSVGAAVTGFFEPFDIPSKYWWLAGIGAMWIVAARLQWKINKIGEPNPDMSMRDLGLHVVQKSKWALAAPTDSTWPLALEQEIRDVLRLQPKKLAAFGRPSPKSTTLIQNPSKPIAATHWDTHRLMIFDVLASPTADAVSSSFTAPMSEHMWDIRFNRQQVLATWPPAGIFKRRKIPNRIGQLAAEINHLSKRGNLT